MQSVITDSVLQNCRTLKAFCWAYRFNAQNGVKRRFSITVSHIHLSNIPFIHVMSLIPYIKWFKIQSFFLKRLFIPVYRYAIYPYNGKWDTSNSIHKSTLLKLVMSRNPNLKVSRGDKLQRSLYPLVYGLHPVNPLIKITISKIDLYTSCVPTFFFLQWMCIWMPLLPNWPHD